MCCLFEIEWGGWKGTVQCSAVHRKENDIMMGIEIEIE